MGKIVGMSTATLSSNGQLVIPNHLREALHLRPGDRVTLTLEGSKLVVQRDEPDRATLVAENGRKVLVAPPGAPPMTAEAVKALLSDFP
jgi:AbrB family looped-hinge helix DNA binding protein